MISAFESHFRRCKDDELGKLIEILEEIRGERRREQQEQKIPEHTSGSPLYARTLVSPSPPAAAAPPAICFVKTPLELNRPLPPAHYIPSSRTSSSSSKRPGHPPPARPLHERQEEEEEVKEDNKDVASAVSKPLDDNEARRSVCVFGLDAQENYRVAYEKIAAVVPFPRFVSIHVNKKVGAGLVVFPSAEKAERGLEDLKVKWPAVLLYGGPDGMINRHTEKWWLFTEW